MEPFYNAPGSVKAIEVLYFEDAEVVKSKGNDNSFATLGSLSVLYFPSYHRYVLQINDWRYPILRRHPIASPDDGSYLLPGPNGFNYFLTINSKSEQAIKNLETLFQDIRGSEASPDDKIVRHAAQKEIGTKALITETIKQAAHKMHAKMSTFKTRTKNVNSMKKKVNLNEIKNKDFKKEAHSTLKKNFFTSTEKLSNEFLQKRRDNVNMKEIKDLKKSQNGPVMYIPKDIIEESILTIKERNVTSSPIVDATLGKVEAQRKGLMAQIKEGIQGMRDSLRGESRNVAGEVPSKQTPVSTEGMGHYQG